jgi:hypothetical protein
MMFLYDLPNWAMGATVSTLILALSLGGYLFFRRLHGGEFSEEERSVAMSMLGVVATINSLLLAFSAVSVWDSFGTAEETVLHEADTVGQLARDLAVFGSMESRQSRLLLREYVETVVREEWEAMRDGRASDAAWAKNDEFFHSIGELEPDTPRRAALLPEIWGRVNELVGHRRDRLNISQAEVPGTLWTVVFVGTVLTMLTTFVLPPTRFNIAMIVALAVTMGLVFFFIVAMDRPFAGEESISPEPFESAIGNMERWDRTFD